MVSFVAEGIEVDIPLSPWDVQKTIIEKCMKLFTKGGLALLESGSGSGKTLAILCASLGWVQHMQRSCDKRKKIIYVSDTDQELERVISEFKKTNYANMKMDVFYFKNSQLIVSGSCANQKQSDEASIIFTTHNALLGEAVSSFSHNVDSLSHFMCLKDAIVILDDAHTIERKCISIASSALNSCVVDTSIQKLEEALNEKSVGEEQRKLLLQVKKILNNLCDTIWSITSINPFNSSYTGWNLTRFCSETKLDEKEKEYLKTCTDLCQINEVVRFLSHVHQFPKEVLDSFILYCVPDNTESPHDPNCRESGKPCRTLHYLCLDPSVVMSKVLDMKPHSSIFTSAILSPHLPFIKELGLDIPDTNKVVVDGFLEDHQIFSRIVTCGAGGYYLNSSCSPGPRGPRFDGDYLTSLGKSVLEVVKVTPKMQGVLIYFSSEEILIKCKTHWQIQYKGQSIWDTIGFHKNILVLPQSLNAHISKGSCLFAVLQRNQLEELNFDINFRRVVMIIGFPSVSNTDPKIQLKKQFNENNYTKQPSRELFRRENYQIVKRVVDYHIRSTSEYGVILLLDCQYNINEFSPYMKKFIETERRFPDLLLELEDFFKFVDTRIEKYSKISLSNDSNGAPQKSDYNIQGYEFDKLKREVNKLVKCNHQLELKVKHLREELTAQDEAEERLKAQISKLREAQLNMSNDVKPMQEDTRKKSTPRKRPFPE